MSKFEKNSRIFVSFVAIMLCLLIFPSDSLTVHANEKSSYLFKVLVEYPEIDVTLPTEGSMYAILNPYGLKSEYIDSDPPLVYSEAFAVTNNGESSVDITFTATGTLMGSAKLVKESTLSTTSNTRDVFMFIHAGTGAGGSGQSLTYNKDNDLLITTASTTKKLLTLGAAGAGNNTGYFQFGGDMNVTENLSTEWTSKEGVKVKVVIKIEPAAV